jgi:hypothetical protein
VPAARLAWSAPDIAAGAAWLPRCCQRAAGLDVPESLAAASFLFFCSRFDRNRRVPVALTIADVLGTLSHC